MRLKEKEQQPTSIAVFEGNIGTVRMNAYYDTSPFLILQNNVLFPRSYDVSYIIFTCCGLLILNKERCILESLERTSLEKS